ncbi:basic proline-rich protein-like [Amblyraja radiata]|uniref:basic proline-rich protein-like n=1 Tax=Amblyraja radiata TaxID=386614 RepID=UPI0014027B12|nr:basic proline-rich protein-like [Amblyraja radiata]
MRRVVQGPRVTVRVIHSAGPVQTVTMPRGIGLNVTGGNNRPPGPLPSGGDSTKVRGGEQLVTINKESLLGVTQEETPSPPSLRPESSVETASVRRGSAAGEGPLPSPPSPGVKPPGFSFLLAPPNYRHGPGPPTGAPPPDRPLQGNSTAKKMDVSPSCSQTNSLPDPHSPGKDNLPPQSWRT